MAITHPASYVEWPRRVENFLLVFLKNKVRFISNGTLKLLQ